MRELIICGEGIYGVLIMISLGNDRGREQDQPAFLKSFSHSAHLLKVGDDDDDSGGWNEPPPLPFQQEHLL